MDPLEELIRRAKDLPTLPGVPLRILRCLDDPKTSRTDVARMLGLDAVLGARVVRLANSPVFGARAAASLDAAVARLGTNQIRNLILTLAVIDAFPPRSAALDMRAFWRFAVASAFAARSLARELRFRDAEEAYLAGLVHDLGELCLALFLPDAYAAALAHSLSLDVGLEVAVRKELKFTPAQLCARVLQWWSFAPAIVEAVEHQDAPSGAQDQVELAGITLAADRLCRELGYGIPRGAPPRAWLVELPGPVAEQLETAAGGDLPVYLERQKSLLSPVDELVRELF
jgi:HD-like signal output (HDOD) protein